MRGPVYFLLTALAIGAGFWTFQVKYAAQDASERLFEMRAERANLEESIRVLRAQIAWASRPERLRALIAAHPELGLAPMRGGQFAAFDELPEPPSETFWARATPADFTVTTETRP